MNRRFVTAKLHFFCENIEKVLRINSRAYLIHLYVMTCSMSFSLNKIEQKGKKNKKIFGGFQKKQYLCTRI